MKTYLPFLILFFLVQGINSRAQTINTIAGGGTIIPGDGGPSTATSLIQPHSIRLDAHGNVYFCVGAMNNVRKIDTSGIITTVAGTGVPGYSGDGGPATAAQLSGPTDVAVDAAGNLYITDGYNVRIRKVSTTGLISTIAGTGSSTHSGDGGPATAAGFNGLSWIAVDAASNIYIGGVARIRKIDPSGIITTFAGTGTLGYTGDGGPATAALLHQPAQMITDGAGNLYFCDDVVRKINSAGIITTIAGTGLYGTPLGDGGPATVAGLKQPIGICIDINGNIYVSERDGDRIRMIDKAGMISTIAGTGVKGFWGDGGPAITAQFNEVGGLDIDCAQNIYLTDNINNRVRKITIAHSPYFIGESSSISVCQNSDPVPINNVLQAVDMDLGQTISWIVDAAPLHGTIGGAPATAVSTGGTLTPAGLTYKPAPGYTGPDQFRIIVGFCNQVCDTRTINVTVNPLPVVAAITGTDTIVCIGKTITLSSSTPGGNWSATTANATVSGGVVTGAAAGTTVINYTVSTLGCSTTASHSVKVKDCPVGIASPRPSPKEREMLVYPNPVRDVIHIDGVYSRATYILSNAVGSVIQEGTVTNTRNVVNINNVANGVYLLEVADPVTGMRTTNKIVKE